MPDQKNLKMHLDGARIWNAATNLKVQESDIARYFDSVSVCFSKGLGAPVGSALVGSFRFYNGGQAIQKTIRWRDETGWNCSCRSFVCARK